MKELMVALTIYYMLMHEDISFYYCKYYHIYFNCCNLEFFKFLIYHSRTLKLIIIIIITIIIIIIMKNNNYCITKYYKLVLI